MMKENRVSIYRKIMSSTAIFSSAQVLTVIINIIRGKLVANILHSTGMGVSSVITSASNTIQQLALMGLNISAVKDISQANTEEDKQVLDFTIRLVRRLILFASLAGMTFTVLFSPLLSKASFGNSDYTHYFLLLGAAIFFNMMGTGEIAVLQGLRRYKLLAFCSIVPPTCGLLISIPIYYVWGIDGIVPAMVVSCFIYYLVIRWFSYRHKKQEKRPRISLKVAWTKGRHIIKFGLVMTIGTFLGTLSSYALTIFISNTGSIEDVGFYQTSMVIASQYIGIIFTAMATDYYPHLSGLIMNNVKEAFRLVNQQMEIVLLIITPLVMLLILTAPLAIRILLTEEFMVIEQLLCFLGMTNIFKAMCFPMDYIAYAKADKAYIFWVETIWGSGKTLTIMVLSYHFFGFHGLAYGALTSAVVDLMVSFVLIPWRYGFRLSGDAVRLFAMMLLLSGICFAATFVHHVALKYAIMSVSTAICLCYNVWQLDRRLNLRALMERMVKKLKGYKIR